MIHCVGGDQDHWPLEIRTAGAFGLTGVENQEHVHGGVSGIVTKDQLGRPRPQRFAEFRHCCFANKLQKIFMQSAKKKRRLKEF